MAIGKVGAYATVQAPNVDFGDIAVNAQKFQSDLIDKMRADKAAKAKEIKPVEVAKFDEVIPAGVKVHDVAVTNIVSEQKNRYADLNKEATEAGGLDKLSSEKQVEYNNIPGIIKKYTEINTKIGGYAKSFLENQSKKSGVQQSQTDIVAHGLDNLEDTEPIVLNGSIMYKFPEIETTSDGNGNVQRKFKVGIDGKKVYRKFYDREGNERDSFDDNELLNGKAFNVMDAYDLTEDAGKISDNIKLRTNTTDNGITSISTTYNDDQRVKEAVDKMINAHVANREQRINVLYNYATTELAKENITPEQKEKLQRYLHPLKESEYTDEDKQIVRDEYKTAIFGGLAPESKENVNLAESRAQQKEKQEQEKYNYTLGRATWAQNRLAGSISRDVDKTAFGFPLVKIPVYSVKAGNYFNEKGEGANTPLPAGSYISNMTLVKRGDKEIPGFVVQQLDAKSSREVQDKMSGPAWTSMSSDQQQEATNSILSSYGNKYTQHIYFFSKEDADNILRQQTLGANKGKGYNVDFAKTTLRNSQPKESKQSGSSYKIKGKTYSLKQLQDMGYNENDVKSYKI